MRVRRGADAERYGLQGMIIIIIIMACMRLAQCVLQVVLPDSQCRDFELQQQCLFTVVRFLPSVSRTPRYGPRC
jgi:hypothetical protein